MEQLPLFREEELHGQITLADWEKQTREIGQAREEDFKEKTEQMRIGFRKLGVSEG